MSVQEIRDIKATIKRLEDDIKRLENENSRRADSLKSLKIAEKKQRIAKLTAELKQVRIG